MRIFQNFGFYPAYLPRLARMTRDCGTFTASRDAFLADRFGACHYLKPVLEGHPDAFFTNGDEPCLQQLWAQEQGMSANASLTSILLAQIEHHRTEVFYNLDPMRFASDFVRMLPSCVKTTIAWRAAPSPKVDFGAYDAVVCNFPSILEGYRKRGWRAEYFSPAHDPEMNAYAINTDRPIDVLFVGGYSRHHHQRAVILEAVSALRKGLNIVFCLDCSRLTRLAELPIGHFLPLASHRRPLSIRAVSHEPVFGRELYAMISKAKIVLNGAVDMAGTDRGNMRCWEALGCGAVMLSDEGVYPQGMRPGRDFETYRDTDDALMKIKRILADYDTWRPMAVRGLATVETTYSKAVQWEAFVELVENI
jgi:Glycosyl transferases group 1